MAVYTCICSHSDGGTNFIHATYIGESVWVGVWCRVEVTVGGCEGVSCGEGQWRGEEGESMSDRVRARGTARKMAFSRACEDAFSHILLVVVPGKPTSAMVYIISSLHHTSPLPLLSFPGCSKSRGACQTARGRPHQHLPTCHCVTSY